jgi:hypothetical protein
MFNLYTSTYSVIFLGMPIQRHTSNLFPQLVAASALDAGLKIDDDDIQLPNRESRTGKDAQDAIERLLDDSSCLFTYIQDQVVYCPKPSEPTVKMGRPSLQRRSEESRATPEITVTWLTESHHPCMEIHFVNVSHLALPRFQDAQDQRYLCLSQELDRHCKRFNKFSSLVRQSKPSMCPLLIHENVFS